MSADLETRITEWGLWFHENKDRIPPENIRRRCDFLEKAVDGCLELIAIATKDIQTLEHRDKSPNLWLPNGVSLKGDLTRFG